MIQILVKKARIKFGIPRIKKPTSGTLTKNIIRCIILLTTNKIFKPKVIMLFQKKKTVSHIGRHFAIDQAQKNKLKTAINKIIGQLETIKKDIDSDSTCDETLTQILAIKGGVQSVGRNLVGKGILDCMSNYSREELELVIKNLFKLD